MTQFQYMERLIKFLHSIPGVAVVTGLLLAIPLVAMQFTDEVDWSVMDFMVMGVLIFGSGLSYVLITRYLPDLIYKVAFASAIGSTLLLAWVNLAVGLIGGGAHAGNLMYLVVFIVVITGTYLSRFTPSGMERTMLASAFTIVILAIVALLTGMQHYPGSSVGEIIGVNAFFSSIFAVSGLFFRYVAIRQEGTQRG